MIIEGTTFSRKLIKSQTEEELADEMARMTSKYDKVLLLCSTTNIDRITTMTKVANKTGKTIIHDILLENVLQLVTQKIPNAINNKNVYVFMPSYLYLMKDKPEYKPYIEPYLQKLKMTGKKLHGKFIMNIRISMLRDIEKLRLKSKVLDNAVVLYSLWEGYKEEKEYQEFLSRIAELGIDIITLHTSGHADYIAIKEMINITKPEIVIPIHTENKEKIRLYTNNAVILNDGEIYKVKE